MELSDPVGRLRRFGQLSLGVLVGLLLGALIWLISAPPRGEPIELLPPQPLRVHVAGSVVRPGVYALPVGSIVQDAIAAAGGLRADADPARLNLAQPLGDGQRIDVPQLLSPSASAAAPQPVSNQGRLPLNSASASDLERLPGIGPVLAQKIVDYRERFGPFQRIEDLLLVEGIGPAKLEALREWLIVP